MEALDLLKAIINEKKLREFDFRLVRHKCSKNWRQINNNTYLKIKNIEAGLKFDNYDVIMLTGKQILKLDQNKITQFTTSSRPLISIASLISQGNLFYHLPLMNIHLDENLDVEILLKVIKNISKRFWLLKTDRYYHVYSDSIMDEDEWTKWNLLFLMSSFLVSPRYIAQSLERGYNLLRLNSVEHLKKVTPYCIYCPEKESIL